MGVRAQSPGSNQIQVIKKSNRRTWIETMWEWKVNHVNSPSVDFLMCKHVEASYRLWSCPESHLQGFEWGDLSRAGLFCCDWWPTACCLATNHRKSIFPLQGRFQPLEHRRCLVRGAHRPRYSSVLELRGGSSSKQDWGQLAGQWQQRDFAPSPCSSP